MAKLKLLWVKIPYILQKLGKISQNLLAAAIGFKVTVRASGNLDDFLCKLTIFYPLYVNNCFEAG